MTFRAYLRKHRKDANPVGDLARDALADPDFPWHSQRVREKYLEHRAITGAQSVVRDRDRVRASGRLVRDSHGDWFQPDLPTAALGGLERGVRPVWQAGAVRVVGKSWTRD